MSGQVRIPAALLALVVGLPGAALQGQPPPRGGAGASSGVYVGGGGGYPSGYGGVYVGNPSPGWNRDPAGVYIGGYPGSRGYPIGEERGAYTGQYGFFPEPTQPPVLQPQWRPRPHPATAEIDVHLPPDATLWFDGKRTGQRGEYREFVSPPLKPGERYYYVVRARWTEDGRPVERTRKVHVRAGEQVWVDFQGPPS